MGNQLLLGAQQLQQGAQVSDSGGNVPGLLETGYGCQRNRQAPKLRQHLINPERQLCAVEEAGMAEEGEARLLLGCQSTGDNWQLHAGRQQQRRNL